MIENTASSGLQSALNSGFQGVKNGFETVRDASANLNQSDRRNIDFNSTAVSLIAGSVQVEAAAEVIKRADGMIGTIIDTYA